MLGANIRDGRTRVQTVLVAFGLVVIGCVGMTIGRGFGGVDAETQQQSTASEGLPASAIAPEPVTVAPTATPATPEMDTARITVAQWRESNSGTTVVCQSRKAWRGIGGVYETPADNVTLLIPRSVWDAVEKPKTLKPNTFTLVGKTVEASGRWGLPDRDGEASRTMRVTALQIVAGTSK